jgi:hypothetical protein
MSATTQQVTRTDEEFLRDAAARIRERMSRTKQSIIEIGRELIAVKDRVGHGKFLPWIEREFGVTNKTAERFMSVAARFGDKFDIVSNLTLTVLYELAAPNTAEEVRTEVTERAAAGKKVTVDDVRTLKGRALVVEHGITALVEAVDRGEVSVPAALAFVRTHPPTMQDRLIIKAGRSVATAVEKANAEAKATVKTKADNAAKPPQGPKRDLSGPADRAELTEARRQIERLRKRVDEFENFLPAYEQWLLEADQIVKSRKRVMSREQWSSLLFCLHPDQRKTRTDEQLDQAYRLIDRLKLVLCDEKEVPTEKPRTPGYDWEARRRAKQSRGSSELTGRKESMS